MSFRKSAPGTRSLEVVDGEIAGRVEVLEFTIKQGAVGSVLPLLLRDEGSPALLKDREIFATLKAPFMPAAIVDFPIVPDKNQFQNRGRVAFVFDEKAAAIAPGIYDLEVRAVDRSGRVTFYPTGSKGVRVTVQASISQTESNDAV
jgi:hypothetical protein